MSAPLDGLRVLELATGVAGPYAGRLLAMLGADVVKVEPDDGDPARAMPVDDRPLDGTSPLFLHLNLGKRNTRRSRVAIERALDWARVVIDDRVRVQVDGSPLDPVALRGRALVLASVTAWGFDAADPGAPRDELLVQAAAGVMTVTGDRDGVPLRFPGWQSQYMAGAYAAASALAALGDDEFHHLDVDWASCIATGVEGGFERSLQTQADIPPAGPHPRHVFPSGAIACADGHVVPGTVRRHDWESQVRLYDMPHLLGDERFKHRGARAQNWRALYDAIAPWYAPREKRDIFTAALDLGLALGMVVTSTDVLSDEHLLARGFLTAADGAFVAPGAPWRTDGLPVKEQRIAAHGEHDGVFS